MAEGKSAGKDLDVPNVRGRTSEREEVEAFLREMQADQMTNMVMAVDCLQTIALYYKRKGEAEQLWHPEDAEITDRVTDPGEDDESE